IVLIVLPNVGSLGLGYGSLAALLFGAVTIMLLDVSSNMCQQPFRMIIGDMVNADQEDKAWSFQNIYSNAGGMLAAILP
ncbi:MFS transporter, partial [Enterococcus lactis]